MANVMDAAKKSFVDEVIKNLFSNIRGGVERQCKRQAVPPSCSIESEQSVSLDDEDLRKYLEEKKNPVILKIKHYLT